MAEIPILTHTGSPQSDPEWRMVYSGISHKDSHNPTFFRHNYNSVNLFNLYEGETVYLIGRGPSLGEFVENKEIKELLLHPTIVRYGMNSSPEVIDNRVSIWSGVDKVSKFSPLVYKNPNILKLIPMHRLVSDGSKPNTNMGKDKLAYDNVHISNCPNTIGVQCCLIEESKKLSFGSAFLGAPAVLFGVKHGSKSVFLFSLKICLLLGFSKIVLIGIDFDMDINQPYYKMGRDSHNAFHTKHNNKLYKNLTPKIKEIYDILKSNKNIYKSQIYTAKEITSMPFIPTINLKEDLAETIKIKLNKK